MRLFTERARTSLGGADYRESPFAYLNRSGRLPAAKVREFLEEAFELFPSDAQRDLRQRFISRNNGQHLAALVELSLMARLVRLGFEVEVHPAVPGTANRPDFRAQRGDLSFLVECTTANPEDEVARADALRFEAVDLLDEIVSDRWTLVYHSGRTGPNPIRRRRFLQDVKAWMEALPDDNPAAETIEDLPKLEWNDSGWEAEIVAYRLKLGVDPEGARGGYMGEVVTVDTPKRLRRAIETKTRSYGDDPEEPLVVVVVPGVEFSREEHLFTALFGDEVWNLQGTGAVTKSWRPNGAWRGPEGLRGGRSSAILYAPSLHVWKAPYGSWQMVHHPQPQHPLQDGLFPFATEVTWNEAGEARTADATMTGTELFGLSDDWPGDD